MNLLKLDNLKKKKKISKSAKQNYDSNCCKTDKFLCMSFFLSFGFSVVLGEGNFAEILGCYYSFS